jgi:hypothetical protein
MMLHKSRKPVKQNKKYVCLLESSHEYRGDAAHEYRGDAASAKCSGNRRRRLGGGDRGETGEEGLYVIYHTHECTHAKEEGRSNIARPPAVTLESGDFFEFIQ